MLILAYKNRSYTIKSDQDLQYSHAFKEVHVTNVQYFQRNQYPH